MKLQRLTLVSVLTICALSFFPAISMADSIPSAPASLISGPNYILDIPTEFVVTFAFGPVTGNNSYSVGPFTSPIGGWEIGQMKITETVGGSMGNAVTLIGTVTDPRTLNTFDFSFAFTALGGDPPPENELFFGKGFGEGFGAQVHETVNGTNITGYGLGLGAAVVTPEPASLLMFGSGALGLVGLLRRRP